MNSCFSLLIPATDESIKASGMFIGLITGLPFMFNYVSTSPSSIDFAMMFLPQTTYLRFEKLNYGQYYDKINYNMTIVLFVQVVGYFIVYYMIEKYFGDGLNDNFIKNKE